MLKIGVIQAGSGTYGLKIDTQKDTANTALRIDSVQTTKKM